MGGRLAVWGYFSTCTFAMSFGDVILSYGTWNSFATPLHPKKYGVPRTARVYPGGVYLLPVATMTAVYRGFIATKRE